MKVELADLNHRLLIEKAREDLRARKNMDVLYMSGSERTAQYTKAIAKLAEDIEKVTEGAYGQANHEIIMDNQIKIEPIKPITANEIYLRYE